MALHFHPGIWRSIRLLVILSIALASLAAPAAPAQSVSPSVVISQVYGGGGNSGATLKNDFIELFNRGTTPVDLAGWSVQYASSAGSSWQKTNLSGVLQPGQYYLVQEAAGAGGTTPLPTPDASGGIAMSASSGKVALVTNQTALTCGAAPGNCFPNPAILDFVGFGTSATNFEGSGPTATLSNTTAALRNGDGCVDSDQNNADFTVGAPLPRNTASPLHTCGGDAAPFVSDAWPAAGAYNIPLAADLSLTFSEPVNVTGNWYALACALSGVHTAAVSGGPLTFTLDPDADFVEGEVCTVTIYAAGVSDQDLVDPPDQMETDFTWSFTAFVPPTPIHAIQGAAHLSPLAGQIVPNATGLVTALRSNGFYMQEPAANWDGDDATSEGIFVFTSSAPRASVGDLVAVRAAVSEFRPGGSGGLANLTTTELVSPAVTVLSGGNPLPVPVVIGAAGRIPPAAIIEDDAAGDAETSGIFDPANDGLDFYESLEGMLVQVDDAVVVGPTTVNGELPVIGDGGAHAGPRTARGGLLARPGDFNPERIILDDEVIKPAKMPAASVSDTFTAPILGVMDYSFGSFKLEVVVPPVVTSGGLPREVTLAAGDGQLSIAAFNVENLSPKDPQAKFDALAGLIVHNLAAPDLLSIEEIQDNNGTTNDGTVAANQTLDKLVSAIQAAGGPAYAYRQINPINNEDGGAPGGNIRVGFLFRTDRGLAFVDRGAAGATDANQVVNQNGVPELALSPGRIDPTNPAFFDSRKPLAGEFTFQGRTFFVIGNHFNSKGGDDPLFGRYQPPVLYSEAQRVQQAQVVHDFVAQILAIDPAANVVVLGDLNDFEFSTPLAILKGDPASPILHDLIETLPEDERYSYVYEGNSETLDHILISPGIFNPGGFAPDVVHVNSEYADQISDHEPQVVRITPNRPPTVSAGGPYSVVEGGEVTLTATGSDPEGGPLAYAWDLDGDGSYETPGQSVTFSAAGLTAPMSVTVAVQATDNGFLKAAATTQVYVIYPFTGFLPFIANQPAFNVIRAGSGVPVKFSLSGDRGLAIIAAGYPKSEPVACGTDLSTPGTDDTLTAGASGLQYDAAADQYIYVWKTEKAWAGTCRQLVLLLDDGTYHRANFEFTK